MNTFFNINYELDRKKVHKTIKDRLEKDGSDYICVADGVILNTANRNAKYLDVVNGGMFSICDSSYVPLYIKWIYGQQYEQYCGSDIFMDIVSSRKYRMIFLGAQQRVLEGLKNRLTQINPAIEDMNFIELPFCKVEEFDYSKIAESIENDGADIIWIALGAPKQEFFMSRLKPHLKHGIMIAVGAAFKFYSGVDTKRAPEWMIKNRLEFIYRLTQEPNKQFKRCFNIIKTLPTLLLREWYVARKTSINN